MKGTVYLLHFKQRFAHAGHYLGWTTDLEKRLARHRGESDKDGRGSRLVEVVTEAGIAVDLVRTWSGDRTVERRIKGRGLAAYCPVCSEKPRNPSFGEDTFRVDAILTWKKTALGWYTAQHGVDRWTVHGCWRKTRADFWCIMRNGDYVGGSYATLRAAKLQVNDFLKQQTKEATNGHLQVLLDTQS